MASPLTSLLSPANYTTKIIMKMNLSGKVIKALISIALGPIAKIKQQKTQQNKLAPNNGIEKELGSPV